MKKQEYHKCGIKKGFCPTLKDFVRPCGGGESKGFSYFAVTDMSVLEKKQASVNELTRIIGIVYRKQAKDRGILLNCCPFCGEDLRPFRAYYVKKEGEK